MLTELLDLLEQNEGGLELREIGRCLGISPGALLGMIDLLVRKGRLIEVGPDGGACTICDLQSNCQLLALKGKRYVTTAREWAGKS